MNYKIIFLASIIFIISCNRSSQIQVHKIANIKYNESRTGFELTEVKKYNLEEALEEKDSVIHLAIHYNLNEKIDFSEFKSLEILELISCKLQEIPASIFEVQTLRALNLSNNNITTLNKSIAKLDQLEVLNLSSNQIKDISEVDFNNLSKLQDIDFFGNSLKTIGKSFDNLKNLKTINISANPIDIKSIDNIILPKLYSLNIKSSQINDLKSKFDLLKNLKTLNLNISKTDLIPEEMYSLKSLRLLSIEGDTKTNCVFTESLNELKNLKALMIQKTKNIEFQSNLSKSNKIESIVLSEINEIKTEEFINKLKGSDRLNRLVLNNCNLEFLHSNVCELINLKKLSLNRNNIESLPLCLRNNEALKSIEIYDNPNFTQKDLFKNIEIYTN